MGLREKKAVNLRKRIVAEALALFGRGGYEQTTMEAIAAAVEISPSTLYRCFPAKDLIVLFPYSTLTNRFCDALALRLQTHSLEESLGHAVLAVLTFQDDHRQETLLTRNILDKVPEASGRLFNFLGELERQSATLIAKHLAKDADDLGVIATAAVVSMVVRLATERWRSCQGEIPSEKIAANLMLSFQQRAVVFPRT